MVESSFTPSKYIFIIIIMFSKIYTCVWEGFAGPFAVWNSWASSLKKNNIDGSQKANSIQSKK